MTEAFFARDGDLLVPHPSAEGGWTPGTLMGRLLAGLIAWGAEQHGEPDLQAARITVDMFKPATMAPLLVDTTVVRNGRRIRVVDVSVTVDGVEVCRGSTVFLRRSADSPGTVWLPPEWDVPDPDDAEPMPVPDDWDPTWEQRLITPWAQDGHRRIWIRETRPFLDGEALTPLVRTALAADNANGQINAGPRGLGFINADLTINLARDLVGEWVGLDATSRAVSEGVSVGTIDLHDRKGRLGHTTAIALADARNLRG